MEHVPQPPTESELLGPPAALIVHGRERRGQLEDKNLAEREASARDMWCRGILDPAAPGVVYWPSISEISRMVELSGSQIGRRRKSEDWDFQRDRNMAALQVSHVTAIEISEEAAERAARRMTQLAKTDDRAFELSGMGMNVVAGMLSEMMESGDQNAGKLQKLASSLETFHKVARTAFCPTGTEDSTNASTINLSINTVTASEELVAQVAKLYCDMEEAAEARAERRNTIQGEVL